MQENLIPIPSFLQAHKSVNPTLLEELLKIREDLRIRSRQKIQFSKPILRTREAGIIFRNTLNIIQGKKGVHKSRLTETICACFLGKNDGDYLGFLRNIEQKMAVLYVDSERNLKDQLPYSIQQIKKRAGYQIEEDPDNFDYVSLINVARKDRFGALKEYITYVQEKYKERHLFIVIDVITDCVENFNDPKESMKLVDLINELINQHNVTVLAVIHENPGGEKARGHLGTELINKASQVIQIGYQKESRVIIEIKFLHSRGSGQIDPIYVRFEEEIMGLILADAELVNTAKSATQKKASIQDLKSWLSSNLLGKQSKQKLMEELTKHFGCETRTIESRLTSLVKEGFLQKLTEGGKAFYELTAPF